MSEDESIGMTGIALTFWSCLRSWCSVSGLSHSIHHNPVRVGTLGLGKAVRASQARGAQDAVSSELIEARLQVLRDYRWSSYHGFVGLVKAPTWLETEWLLGRMGGGRLATQRRRYRQEAETKIGERDGDSPWDSLEGGILLGAKEWVEQMRRVVKGDAKEQPEVRRLQVRPNWKQVVEGAP